MGYDCGFDIYPRLEPTAKNKEAYRQFLDEIIKSYGQIYDRNARNEDGMVLKIPSDSDPDSKKCFITFMVGECPHLPSNPEHCTYFLRFSSKVSGNLTTPAEPYIRSVFNIARKYFGSRVCFWHELNDQYGCYSWNEVYEAEKKIRNLESGQERTDKREADPMLLDTTKVDLGRQYNGTPSQFSNSKRVSGPSRVTDHVSTSYSQLHLDVVGNEYYAIRPITNKGLGLIATSKIPKGTRILSEAPLFRLTRILYNTKAGEDQVIKSLKSLDKERQRAFFALRNVHEGNPVLGIVRTNALALGSNATESGIFLRASRINHSCRENAQNIWNAGIGQLTIHALRDIDEGEEITISYLADRAGYEDRQKSLKEKFKFDCKCHLCMMPPDRRKESDDRLSKIRALDKMIFVSANCAPNLNQQLYLVRCLLQVIEEEGIWDNSIQRAYYDAYQIAISHGDIARAKIFVKRSYEAAVVIQGEDGTGAKEIKKFQECPTSHQAYGILATKGHRSRKSVPSG
ncbi:hypothetical protein ACHAXS_007625 [Conticribra weissflogii]